MLPALCAALLGTAFDRSDAPPKGYPTGGFLIVATDAVRETLVPFVEHKRKRLPTELVTLEAALKGSPGVDDPEKLKHYLYDAWKTRHVRYVLLAGDADVMPVRYMVLDRVTKEAFDYAFYPSDLYYADVAKADGSFDDWNGAKDGFHAGYFGEVRGEKNKDDPMNFDSVSYVPELAVGRWPVSTPEQAKVIADKTMAYEGALEKGEIKPTAALLVAGGWVDVRSTMDSVAGKFAPAWNVEKRYYSDQSTPVTPPPDEVHIVGLLNGGASVVLHAGHGSDDTWAGCFGVGSIAKLSNSAHPAAVMMSAGCSTARFATLPPYEAYTDVHGVEHKGTNNGEVFTEPPPPPACYAKGKYNMTGLGKRLLRDGPTGAVCYIGCNTGSQPCAMTLEAAFAEEVGNGKWVATATLREGGSEGGGRKHGPRVGDCWAAAVAAYYDREHLATLKPDPGWYPASIFFQGMKFMLFGDPTVELPTGR